MATYVNDLRLKEIATGDESGTWGTSTNTNLELIADAFSYATKDCFATDADATETMADGVADEIRSLYLKVTSSATLTATRTLTLAPNTVSKTWIIENATTGSQSISISQGSGANVTIPNGDTKIIYTDGAGSGAAVTDAFASLNVGDLTAGAITADTISLGDYTDALTLGASSDLSLYHDGTNSQIKSDTGQLILRTDAFRVLNNANSEQILHGDANGAVTAYYDNSVKLATTATGIDVTGTATMDGLTITAATPSIQMTDSDNNADAYIQATDGNIRFYADDNAEAADSIVTFNIDGSEKMRIDSSGNVGINTTTSGHPLAVQATSATNPQLHFETSAYANAYGTKILVASTNEAGTTSSFYNLYKTTASVNGRSDVQQYLSFVGSSAASDYQYWSTGGSERMRIDGSGMLLVNTTSSWSGETTPHIESRGDVAGDYTGLIVSNTNDAAGDSVSVNFGLARDGGLVFGNAGKITVGKEQDWTGTPTTVDGFMSFSTMLNESLTEHMRIMSNGAIGMGFTSQISGGTLSVFSSGDGGVVIGSSGGSNAFRKIYHNPANGILYFVSSGNAPYLSNAGSWVSASDIAIKKDIEDIDYGLETVKSLQPRRYKMKDTEEKQVGFVAQEIEQIVPEVVSGEDGKKGVSYGQITPLLVKAIQEQQTIIESLEARITALES